MGVVYKVEDTRLHRLVALKFLARTLLADPQRPRNVPTRSASASALNHPNICTIYASARGMRQTFIAMSTWTGDLKHRIAGNARTSELMLALAV